VFDRLATFADEFRELEARLSDPATMSDPTLLRTVSRRYRELEPIVAAYHAHVGGTDDLAAARELIESATEAERPQLQAEIDGALADIERIESEVRELLLPRDPNAGRAVIIEIRGAEGGEEANLFAGDLHDMYEAYSIKRGWKVETLSHDPSDLGGINQITFVIRGDDAWQRMKFEGTLRLPLSLCSPKPTRSTSQLTIATCKSTCIAPVAPADNMSTRPTPLSGSPTCRLASW
jgi:peptide chain release factor 1